MIFEELLAFLKAKNYRSSKTREVILAYLINTKSPVSVSELLEIFQNKPNKTTVYREINILISNNILKELDFGEGKKRYELKDHHHHLVCKICKKIECIAVEPNLRDFQNNLEKLTNFKIEEHLLEFFGYCQLCR